jgi:hypothetical protein
MDSTGRLFDLAGQVFLDVEMPRKMVAKIRFIGQVNKTL